MVGSRREPLLTEGQRKFILSLSSWGTPLSEVMQRLQDCIQNYPGDIADLMFGYWEYGDEIVVSAPETDADREAAIAKLLEDREVKRRIAHMDK